MAFSRQTVGDQSPSERLCLRPDSRSLTRASSLVRGRHLDVLSPCRRSAAVRLVPTSRLGICNCGWMQPRLLLLIRCLTNGCELTQSRIDFRRAPKVAPCM
jgi:hypothetical protein